MRTAMFLLIALVILGFLAWGVYENFFHVVNEVGYLGMNAEGRQLFIKSLDRYFEGKIGVDSGLDNHSLMLRMFSDPMTTTLKCDYRTFNSLDAADMRLVLDQHYEDLLFLLGDNNTISLDTTKTMTISKLEKRLKRYDQVTFEDMLVSLGFKEFKCYHNGEFIGAIKLHNKGNALYYGGFLKVSKPAHVPPKMAEDLAYLAKHHTFPADYE